MTNDPAALRRQAAALNAEADQLDGLQYTADQLNDMSTDEILEAQQAGRLNVILGAPAPHRPSGQITQADLESMSNEQIIEAQNEGRLDHLLGRHTSGLAAPATS